MNEVHRDIKDLAVNDPTISVALIEHYRGMPYVEMLERLVVMLTGEKRNLRAQVLWYAQNTTHPNVRPKNE